MRRAIQLFANAALVRAVSLPNAAWAVDHGYFGFKLAIDGDGLFLNPVNAVMPGRLMAAARRAKAQSMIQALPGENK